MATFLGFPVAASSASAAAPSGLIPEESWRARLAGRLLPGASGMSAGDRDAMMRQGLLGLAAGMASTGGQGTAAAIGNGLQSGLLAMNQGRDSINDAAYKKALMDRQLGDPAGLREFNAMTDGLSDEDKLQARRVRLGLEGRASSGGIGFDTFTDANGFQRPQRNNPRTGSIELWIDESQQWVPLGSAGEVAPGSQPVTRTATANGMPISIGDDVPPAMRAMIEQFEAQQRPIPANVHLPEQRVPTFTPAPVPGIGRGRRKEDEAAAVAAASTAATRAAELQYLPAELGMRADTAVDQAARIASTTGAIELANERTADTMTRARDANTAIGLLDEAERILPTATGSTAGAAADRAAALFGRSTSGAQSTAQLKTIAGQLVSRMPRMEGPQSDKDVQLYKDMAGNLADDTLPVATRQAAAQQIRRLQEKYANPQAPAAAPRAPASQAAPRRLRYNPATGSLE